MTALSRRAFLLGSLTAVAVLPLTGCSLATPATRLTMATGEQGGSYLQFGDLLAATLHPHNVDLTVTATNGSGQNLSMLVNNTVDLAIALADSAKSFHSSDIVAVGRIYQNYLHCIARDDGPIHTLDDLAGHPISIGAHHSGTALTTARILDAHGLTSGPNPAHITQHTLDDAATLLESGTISAFFWSGGIPTTRIDDLRRRTPIRLIALASSLPLLPAADRNVYLPATIPAGVYGVPHPTPTIGIPNILLCRLDLPDPIAATLVDVLVDDAAQLVPANTVGIQYLTPSSLIDTASIPLHPAARERYRQRYG